MFTFEDFDRELKLDETRIGSSAYEGLAYFWNYDYRHYLRDSSPYRRRLVHSHLLKAGLTTDGNTDQHTAIVTKYSRPR